MFVVAPTKARNNTLFSGICYVFVYVGIQLTYCVGFI